VIFIARSERRRAQRQDQTGVNGGQFGVLLLFHNLRVHIKEKVPSNLIYKSHIVKSTVATKVDTRSQRMSRRKETLLKEALEMAVLRDVGVAYFHHIRKSGRLITYKFINCRRGRPGQNNS
jgi:hypothetical protein